MPKIYTVEIDGKQYDIEGDRPPTEEEARAAVGAYTGATAGVQAPPSPEPQPGLLERAAGAVGGAEGIPGIIVGQAKAALNTVGSLGQLARKIPGVAKLDEIMPPVQIDTEAKNAWQVGGKALETAAEIGMPLRAVTPMAVRRSVAAFAPGAAKRAGAKIGAAEAAATEQGIPVLWEKAAQYAREMVDNSVYGDYVPKVARAAARLSKREGKATELTAKEARKLYHNVSNLSLNERGNLNAYDSRRVGEFKGLLDAAIREAMLKAGKGAEYAQGMEGFAKAMTAKKLRDILLKKVLPVAGLGWLGGKSFEAGYDSAKKLF